MIEYHERQELEWRFLASLVENPRLHRRAADFDAACITDHAAQAVYQRLRRDSRSGIVAPLEELRRTVAENQVDDHGTDALVDRCVGLLSQPYREEEFLYAATRLQDARELALLGQAGAWITQQVQHLSAGDLDREAMERLRSGILDKLRPATTMRQTELLPDVLARVLEAARSPQSAGRVPAFRTGFGPLDDHAGGIRRGELWVVAARTGVGKTHFAVQMTDRVARGFPVRTEADIRGKVLTINLEMSGEELGRRALAHRSKVGATTIEQGTFALDRELDDAVRRAEVAIDQERGFVHYDTLGSITAPELEAQVRKVHAYHGLDFLVVDYLGLVKRPHKSTRAEEIGEIAMLLKSLAKDLQIGVLVVAQINRQGADGEVELHHLKDSGDIEQAADGVVLLIEKGGGPGRRARDEPNAATRRLRESRGNPIEDMPDPDAAGEVAAPPWAEQIRLALRKCRRAEAREWTANFVKSTSTFVDTDEYDSIRPLDWGFEPAPGVRALASQTEDGQW